MILYNCRDKTVFLILIHYIEILSIMKSHRQDYDDQDSANYDNTFDADSISEVNEANHSSNLDLRRDIDPNSVYELVSLIGEGSYGAVYKAYLRGGRSDHFSSSASSSYEMQVWKLTILSVPNNFGQFNLICLGLQKV